MKKIQFFSYFLLFSILGVSLLPPAVCSAVRPEKVHLAELKKTQSYLHDGLFVGGDRAIADVVVRDIRRASNAGFERLVIDLEGSRNGEPVAMQRPPYYQIAVSPEERRIVFTLWGHSKLQFEARKVLNAFKKSRVVDRLELLPKLEEDSWTFVAGLKSGEESVEVFELSSPARIIVDIRPGKGERIKK